jgi:hypothetical protein
MKVISKPIKKADNEEAGEQQTKGAIDQARKMDKNSNTVSNPTLQMRLLIAFRNRR